MSRATTEIVVEGRRLRLSNLDKVFYPAVGFTKGQVIDYYARIAPVLLPHLKGRPLTLKRYPNGVEGPFFYEKNCPAHRPAWVKTVPVWSEGNARTMDFCLADDLPTLVWAANLADLELHTALHRSLPPGTGKQRARAFVPVPTMIAFDLDPGAPADVVSCSRVALLLRDLFDGLGLVSYPKTSGSKGLQLYVPLNTKGLTYDRTKTFARAVAEAVEKERPELVVSNMKKSLRTGKVLIDWSQNDDHKTTVCVYSLRAKERPTVSTPVEWDEVERCAAKGDPDLLVFTADRVLERVKRHGDLFEEVLTRKQRLPRFQ